LNEAGIVPLVCYGFGFNLAISEFGEVRDIDLVVSDEIINNRALDLEKIMTELGFKPIAGKENEFEREGEEVDFSDEGYLNGLVKVDYDKLKVREVEGAKFKELSPQEYLALYQSMYKDKSRGEVKNRADMEKVERIEEYCKRT